MTSEINIVAPINQLGYGVAGLNILKSLSSITKVALWPIGQPQVVKQEDAQVVSEAIKRARRPDFSAPCIKIWHQDDMSQFSGKGLRIGFPIFELDEFNDLEKHHLSSLDKIFVCSQWAKEIMLNAIDINKEEVYVIPLGVDRNIFKPIEKDTNDKTVFFNCGKWEVRKGHDILVTAFNEAFDKNDNVELWMMCENPFFSESEQLEWIGLYKNSKLGEKIRIIGRVETQEEVYNIMSQTDCGVFPSRGEGWNLELLEMMSCGKIVIATNCSAHTEFCNTDNCILIEPGEKEVAYDGKWFHGKCGSWASMGGEQVKNISTAMAKVHHANSKAATLNTYGIDTASNYSWSHSASHIMKALKNV